METSQTINLYITFVEKEGPFLKIWGQTEKNSSIYIEQFLLGASPQFDLGVGKISIENLQAGTLVCAKYKDNKYYRARITNVSFLHEGFVEVSFLDYGNKDVVPCANIRSLHNFPSSFISVPPLATGFIFAEAHCPGGGEWNDTIFENISKEIKYREVQCTLLIQATQYFLVKLFIGNSDLCGILINRGLMQPISLQAQQAVLLSMSMQRQNIQLNQPPTSTGINTYKACTLEPGCQYPVYVSYVNDGPCHFSVQLKQSEEVLVMLMNDINAINLRLLEDVPIPGTICLARCQEDGNICRAVVTNEVDNQFKVFYVDFGNYEVVPLDSLYQIPFKYVLPKVMAIRFALAGVEKSTVTIEMQCAFKQFVDNRLLHMKVLPTPTRMAIPKCDLWDPETKTSALDVVKRAAQNAYPEPVSLSRGFSQPVKVSYVYSCSRFYVQLVSKENELLKLMLDLQASCQTNDSLDPSTIKKGLPCCALFESDEQWYRSQIVEVLGPDVKVRYIDYGNEETVPISQLKIIDGEQLTVLRPQAIECCLNGYQNMQDDIERDTFLEELILEGQFTMKVVEMTNKKALVELFDDSNYNVASLLLDKLATAKSQASPLLVQAGNKIEHRKSFTQQTSPRDQNFRQDYKSGRDKGYERTNDRTEKSWRNDNNKDFRENDRNSNENNEGSWRQNNKGFSPNSERPFNKDKSRNRNDWKNMDSSSNNDDNWNTDNKTQENDDWNTQSTPPSNTGYQNKYKDNDFNRNKGRFDHDKGNWNANGPKGGYREGGYKKHNDFRKDGSEVSSSGSEKSFQKGPRTSSRNDRPKFQKKFDKPRNASFNNTTVVDDSWNVSSVTPSVDAAPVTATFAQYDVVGKESKIIISWFHNPGHFFCQMADYQSEFKTMMEDIQQFYKSLKPESSVVGAPIIGLFPEDNVLYRARVLEANGSQYKVYYVDFGNVSTISKVWPIEKKFMNLPAQAIVCSLSGISAPDNKWPDPDNYSKYFDKDMFSCTFISKDEEKTYIDLFYGNENITQLLLQDGLAVANQPDIEIPLLLGQQFRAVIKSVNNLSDIIIALECGLAISCTMHNLETAIETFEDVLKSYLNETVLVYVDNVICDKLEVTLYDTDGSKIIILNPDEGAYDTVEPLCPPLVLRSSLTGYVCHADETSIFIHPAENAEIIPYLLDQMFEFYDSQKQDIPIIPEEDSIYAVHSEDGNWYRAKVVSFDDEQATASFVDYGNSESVAFSELRELDQKFLEYCTLCVEVKVNESPDTFVDKEVIATLTLGENGWGGTIQVLTPAESSATESAEAYKGDSDIITNENLKESDPATQEPIDEVATVQNEVPSENVLSEEVISDSAENVPDSSIEVVPQTGTQVLVSHIDSPNEFYVQLAESLNAIDKLQLNLQEEVIDMPVLENATAGIQCAAPYSADQQWYRAEVLDADDDITTVRFIDYGNTDVIDNKTTEIKTLPPNLLSLAVYATRCSLKVRSTDEEWGTTAIETFESLAQADNITAEFLDQDEKTHYVELYSNGQSIKDLLIQENLCVPVELSTESKSTCFVSHLNSPSEFWIQLENCVDELEWIAEQLSGAENFPELEDLTPGTLCAALFPDDEMWYRARILSNTVAGLELLFIDYGNSSMSNSLRQLPEDLVVTPPLAQKCCLQRPEGFPYWSPQAVNKFSEISADGQTIFTVHKISTGETSVVQLFIDGEDVASMLLPITENGYVKDITDLDSLTIEKDGTVLPETYKLENMPGMTWNEESIDKFKELNNEGETLFEIEFLPENIVRLYFKGNDIRTSIGGIKTASLNVSKADTDNVDTEDERDIAYLDETVAGASSKVDLDKTTDDSELKDFDEKSTISNQDTQRDMAVMIEEEFEKALNEKDGQKIELQENTGIEKHTLLGKTPSDDETPVDVEAENEKDNAYLDETVAGASGKDDLVMTTDDSEQKDSDEKRTISSSNQDTQRDIAGMIEEEFEKALNEKDGQKIELQENTEIEKHALLGKTPDNVEAENEKDNAHLDETVAGASGKDDLAKTTDDLEQKDSDEKSTISSSNQHTQHDVAMMIEEEFEKALNEKDGHKIASQKNIETEKHTLLEKTAEDKTSIADVAMVVKEESEVEESPIDEVRKLDEGDTVEAVTDTAIEKDLLKTDNANSSSQDTGLNVALLIQEKLEEALKEREAQVLVKSSNSSEKGQDDTVLEKETTSEVNHTQSEMTTQFNDDQASVPTSNLEPKNSEVYVNSTDPGTGFNIGLLIQEEFEKALTKKELGVLDRPSSSCSEKRQELQSVVEEVATSEIKNIQSEITTQSYDEQETSRPSSRLSGKIKHDDRILPAAISRPHSPQLDVDCQNSEVEDLSSSNVNMDIKYLDEGKLDKQDTEEISRPASAASGKISYDERVVPAALSRPHSPITSQSEVTEGEDKKV